MENSGILAKIVENLNFAIWKKSVLELCRAATIKPRKIERSVFFFYLTAMDKLKFKNGGLVQEKSRFPPGMIRVKGFDN